MLLLIAGMIYLMLQLHRRGHASPLPADAALTDSLEFHRRELERQRDALRTVWHWYLLPIVPGLGSLWFAGVIELGLNAGLITSGIFFVFVLVGTWEWNRRGARKLDRKIQEIRAMESDRE